jgi:outer membrane protein assembly factor BamB
MPTLLVRMRARSSVATLVSTIVSLCLVAAIIFPAVQASPAENWPMFHKTPSHTGYTNSVPIKTTPKILWSFETNSAILSSVATSNDTVYVSNHSQTYALNISNGAELWETFGGYSSPAIYNGILYTGHDGGSAYNASTGKTIWSIPHNGSTTYSPIVVNGVVYIENGVDLYAVNAATGTQIWKVKNPVHTSPTYYNGHLYVGNTAFDASNGAKLWEFPLFCVNLLSTPAVYDGYVYFGAGDRNVYCLNAQTGTKVWNYSTGSGITTSPAIANNRVFIGSTNGNLYAFDAKTGAKLWNYSIERHAVTSSISSSPAVAQDVVYVVSNNGNLYAFDVFSGEKLWNLTISTSELGVIPMSVSPVISNGVIYIGSNNRTLYALGSANVNPSPSVPEYTTTTLIISIFVLVTLPVILATKRLNLSKFNIFFLSPKTKFLENYLFYKLSRYLFCLRMPTSPTRTAP